MTRVFAFLPALALAACGPAADTGAEATSADAPPAEVDAAAPPPEAVAEVFRLDPVGLLGALGFSPDAEGRVVNACDAVVEPLIVAVELGAALPNAQAVVVPGGPEAPTCYGDGPGAVMLAAPNGDGWDVVLMHQGYVGILDTETDGARDVALGGPGFSFPVFAWDGASYEPAGRMIPDTDFGAATVVP